MIENCDRHFPEGAVLLGNSAYGTLITPYIQAEPDEDQVEADFNEMFSGIHQVVERASGTMVSKWRFLSKFVYVLDIKRIVKVVTCCAVLHDFCIDMNDT